MALKRTRVLGWTKQNSAHQALVNQLSRKGQIDDANKLNELNRLNHSKRVETILRAHKHRGA